MRLFIVGLGLLLTTTAAAQSRWTFSGGPEWSRGTPVTRSWSARLRVEYDLTRPNSVFGLRVEGGAGWGPTQSFLVQENGMSWGETAQRSDLMLGLNTSLSPIPHSRVAPYISFGLLRRYQWVRGSWFFRDSLSLDESTNPTGSWLRNDWVGSFGMGLRPRFVGHSFQLEVRRLYDHNGMTFGTRLPF